MDSINLETIRIFIIWGGVALALLISALVLYLVVRRKRRRRDQLSANTRPSKARTGAETGLPANGVEGGFGLQFTQESGITTTFTALPASIGRDVQNDLVLDDETVSPQHARVYYDGFVGAVCIMDLDSAGGIRIDGHPTRKNVLQNGVIVRLGDAQLEFRDTGYIHPDPL